jgi:hypothetical protein
MGTVAPIRYSGLVRLALGQYTTTPEKLEKLEGYLIEHRLIPSPDLLCAIRECESTTLDAVPPADREAAKREARRILAVVGDAVKE